MAKDQNKSIQLSIREVASLLNVTASTIRNWEKYGLFTAKRAENGYRYFDFADVAKLKLIKKYMVDDSGRNRALRKIHSMNVDNEDPVLQKIRPITDAPLSTPVPYSGERWKTVREREQYTLEDVAHEIGISASYLSKIENNRATPSYDILTKLAHFYNESLVYFIESADSDCSVTRKKDAPIIDLGYDGIVTHQMSSLQNRKIFPVKYTLQPGSNSGSSHAHNGEEFVYILSGELTIYLNHTDPETVYILQQGDAMSFKSSIPHRYVNDGKQIASVLWIHST